MFEAGGCTVDPHDISPPFDEQLVLKLEAWVTLGEAVNVLLGSGGRGLALPMDQDLVDASGQPGS